MRWRISLHQNTRKLDDVGESMNRETQQRLTRAYLSEKPRLISRLKAIGRTLEEAEDIVHDVYAEVLGSFTGPVGIRNLPAWINMVFKRRVIDAWRRDKMRASRGETEVSEEALRDIISGAGLNPLDSFVQESLVDALNSALKALPGPQRKVMEAQVFGGLTFREISQSTGESIDTLTARKRYAIRKLSKALRHWIDE